MKFGLKSPISHGTQWVTMEQSLSFQVVYLSDVVVVKWLEGTSDHKHCVGGDFLPLLNSKMAFRNLGGAKLLRRHMHTDAAVYHQHHHSWKH